MLTQEIKDFIADNLHADTRALMLALSARPLPFSLPEAVTQIECRRRCEGKLPGFLKCADFRFADTLSSEQCTHEAVARFHSQLVAPGSRVLDMTAGLGIDAMSIAAAGSRVTACELNSERASALADNAAALGISLQVENADSTTLLNEPDAYDLIFIDPARRDAAGRRTYGFADCTPDILTLMPRMLRAAPRILIKASPLLDITMIQRELPPATRIWAVSIGGECKELLVEVTREGAMQLLTAVDIDRDGRVKQLSVSTEGNGSVVMATDIAAGQWLYEPSASLMKLAPWGEVCRKYPGLKKLDSSTHLFVADEHYPDFQGRVTRIDSLPTGKEMKALRGEKINIVSRNHPLTPEQLRKKYSLRDTPTPHRFLYALRQGGRPRLLLTTNTKP